MLQEFSEFFDTSFDLPGHKYFIEICMGNDSACFGHCSTRVCGSNARLQCLHAVASLSLSKLLSLQTYNNN